ncbi:MAG: outer membrane beta-barrel protein [Planctomycetota bacterium]
MFGLKKLRFVDIGTGLSMMFGTAGLLVASALHAAEPGCTPAPSCATIQGGGCCDKVFEDAAERLKNLNPGCCAPAGNACAAPAACTPAPSVCNPNAVFNGCGSGCGNGCGHGLLDGDLGEPWTVVSLFDDECGKNRLKDNGWILGGFTQFGYQSAPDGAFAGNGPFVNQKEYKTFALNQQYLFLGKVADGTKGFDWGFRADVLFGLDGNDAQSFGNRPGRWDFQEDFNHGAYEWAIPQLYAEVAMNNLSVKLGHFYTPIGYEVVPSNGNFFLSRQLTFYNSEPFTHTGALATYKASDKLSVIGGYVYGMDTGFDQFNDGSAAIGGFTYAIDDKTSLIYAGIFGNLGWRGDGAINSAILTRKWGDKFSTVHQFDVLNSNLGSNFNGNPTDAIVVPGEGVAGDSIGFINYAFYDVTAKTKAGVRYEWYKADGTSYQTLTGGVNVKPMANLVIRPEVRYMFSEGNNQIYNGPRYSDTLFNQTQFGIDAILTY